jgi:hypothetical protein
VRGYAGTQPARAHRYASIADFDVISTGGITQEKNNTPLKSRNF